MTQQTITATATITIIREKGTRSNLIEKYGHYGYWLYKHERLLKAKYDKVRIM